VKIASEKNLCILATDGGHSGTITSEILNGIQVDLSLFKNVALSADASTLTVGGGVLFGEIYNTLYAAGKEIRENLNSNIYNTRDANEYFLATGSSSCVGLLGATLGGGIGRLQGLHGLTLDALVSVDIVVASGALVTASKTKNPDLFWAIRGAGANFGIIVSATYKTYDTTSGGQFLDADFIFPFETSTKYFETLKSFDTTLPAGLSLTSSLRYNASAGLVCFHKFI
jgi:FAD/FMN-containing dehydrogenase